MILINIIHYGEFKKKKNKTIIERELIKQIKISLNQDNSTSLYMLINSVFRIL